MQCAVHSVSCPALPRGKLPARSIKTRSLQSEVLQVLAQVPLPSGDGEYATSDFNFQLHGNRSHGIRSNVPMLVACTVAAEQLWTSCSLDTELANVSAP